MGINFFMYGILIPYKQYEAWENVHGRNIPAGIYGNIFCFFSRDTKYIIVGKKFNLSPAMKNEHAFIAPELTQTEKNEIESSVKEKFGFEGDFHLFFVKNSE